MGLLFGECTDLIGSCIRQYVVFFLCLVISALAGYSCYKTYRLERRFTFQMLPLVINTLTCLIMLGFYLQLESVNADLYLFIVQFYSYFILCFGFVIIVIKQSEFKTKIKLMIKIFIAVSSFSSVAIVVLLVVQNTTDSIGCRQEQGIGKVIVLSLEVPLILVTLYFIRSFKRLLQSSNQLTELSAVTKHLIEQQDRYIILKKRQANLVMMAQIANFIFHLAQIVLYYAIDQQSICSADNETVLTNNTQLILLWLQNVVELFPHFIIPFIFWYMPAKLTSRYQTLFISQQSSEISFRNGGSSPPKLKTKPSDDSQFYQNMQNQEQVRRKLVPESPTLKRNTSI